VRHRAASRRRRMKVGRGTLSNLAPAHPRRCTWFWRGGMLSAHQGLLTEQGLQCLRTIELWRHQTGCIDCSFLFGVSVKRTDLHSNSPLASALLSYYTKPPPARSLDETGPSGAIWSAHAAFTMFRHRSPACQLESCHEMSLTIH
jgi:hypothetical protein